MVDERADVRYIKCDLIYSRCFYGQSNSKHSKYGLKGAYSSVAAIPRPLPGSPGRLTIRVYSSYKNEIGALTKSLPRDLGRGTVVRGSPKRVQRVLGVLVGRWMSVRMFDILNMI